MTEQVAPSLSDYKLPPEAEAIAKRLAKEVKIGPDHSANVDKQQFIDAIPADLSLDVIRRVDQFRENFMAGVSVVFGENANPYFKKHKDVKRLELNVPMDRAKFEGTIDREKQWPGRGEGADPIVKKGVFTSGFTVAGDSASRGALKKVRTYIGDLVTASVNG